MDELLIEYKDLLARKKFKPGVTPELIVNIQKLLPEERKILVFSGRHDGKKLGSILIASSGKTCTYFVGSTNSNGREMNVNYYLLWNAICEMQRRGCKWFDVGGAHPDNTPPGILHFKRGLRGKPYQLMGETEAYQDCFFNKMIKKRVNLAKRSLDKA
jgi:lipid II:glycine glycyltransferase (peptidoglycan interpeptide bridge formation enzyme)